MTTTNQELTNLKTENAALIRQLKFCEEKYNSVNRIAGDTVIIADSKGFIMDWNVAAETMFGYDKEDILGKPLTIIIPDESKQRHDAAIERSRHTWEPGRIRRNLEYNGLHKNGAVFPIRLSLTCWTSNGDMYFTGIIRDVSQRKKTERELERLRHEYESFMRHELQNKITPIMGYAELLLQSFGADGDKEQKKYLNRICDSVEKTSQLIDKIKILQNFEHHSAELNLLPYDVINVVSSVMDDLAMTADSVQLVKEINTTKSHIMMDMNFLPGVFHNLIKNAIEHVAKLEDPQQKTVTVRMFNQDAQLIVTINNKGACIPPERLELFFEKFNSDPSKKGTGLGTSYAYLITQAHNGEICVNSNESDGTTVSLKFITTDPA